MSHTPAGAPGGGESLAPSVCSDGRFVAFSSLAEDLVGSDSNTQQDVFVWDRENDAVQLLSRSATGLQGNGASSGAALSPDGRFVAFQSAAGNLVDDDTNSASDVFVVEFAPRSIERVADTTRYTTAIKASNTSYPASGSADAVVLATGLNWPDALGGAALAGVVDGPLLLTPPDEIPAAVEAEIERLGASTVYILGLEGAVGPEVYEAAKKLAGVSSVERIGGLDRYETAERIAKRVWELDPAADGTVFVATGRNYPDALAASPAAAAMHWPILLVDPRSSSIETSAAVTRALILGGTGVVSPDIEADLEAQLGAAQVERWAGPNRYATAADVAIHAEAETTLSFDDTTIATGQQFPDALSGGVMAGKLGGVMLLTTGSYLRSEPAAVLEANRDTIASAWIMGGTGAISESTKNAVATALGE